MPGLHLFVLLPVLCLNVATSRAASPDAHCLDVTQVTAFAPRGEVYVTLRSECRDIHFGEGDPVIGSVEVLVGSLPPRHEDFSVYRADPDLDRTLVFENLTLEKNANILVRLTENGDVVEVLAATAR